MNNFNLSDIQNLINQALKEEPTGDDWLDSRYNEQVHYIGHTNPYYKLFYLIAKTLKPELVVELGSWQATGAAHFAAGSPETLVITVDIHKDDLAAKERTIEATKHYPNLFYYNMWTWDAVETIKQRAEWREAKLDCLFIDAWHDYEYVKREWELYSSLLSSPALVICDDITTAHNFEGMLKFWDELPYEKFLDNQVHKPIPMGFVKYMDRNRTADSVVKPATTRRRKRKS